MVNSAIPPIRVFLVQSSRLLMEGLAHALCAGGNLALCGQATRAEETLAATRVVRPNVIVLDASAETGWPAWLARQLADETPRSSLVILVGDASDAFLKLAVHTADAIVSKDDTLRFLVEVVERVHAGERCYSESICPRIAAATHSAQADDDPRGIAALTARQLEVLRHLARGDSVKEVARTLHISQKSVDSHKYRIMHKLGIHDRVQLARMAIREGLLVP